MKILIPFAALLLCLPAWSVTVTTTGGTTSSVPDIDSTITFGCAVASTADPGGNATYTGGFGFNGGTNPGGGCNWLSQNGQTTVITFSQPIDYFGLLWGSPDTYNQVRTYDVATGGSPLSTTNGTGGYVNFFAGPGEQFLRIELSSSQCCFETDNHSYRLADTAIPEPSSIALAALGLAALAGRRFFF